MDICDLKRIPRKQKKKTGVYILRNENDQVIYVGQSTDICNRVTQHRNKPWTHYQFIIEENDATRGILESELINKYEPFYNKIKIPVTVDWYKKERIKKKQRRELIEELIKRYGEDLLTTCSCRMVQRLLYQEWAIYVNHNTINKDLKIIRAKKFCNS